MKMDNNNSLYHQQWGLPHTDMRAHSVRCSRCTGSKEDHMFSAVRSFAYEVHQRAQLSLTIKRQVITLLRSLP